MDHEIDLEKRVRQLENRVQLLEKQISELTPKKPKQLEHFHTSITTHLKKETPLQTSTSETIKEKEPIQLDVLIFQKIVPRLFILVFIIGVLWGFKAASDYGLLNEKVRVAMGFIVSIAFIFLGHIQINRKRNRLGQVLLGGAIPILMLTTFSMHQLYDMIGPTTSFGLNIVWIALGLLLTHRYQSQVLGIVSSIGGVLVPFLIESTTPNVPVFILYETTLYLLFIWLSLRKKYQILYYVSAISLNIALFFFVAFSGATGYEWLKVAPILVQQAALLVGFIRTNTYVKQQAYTLFSSLVLSSIWVDAILARNEVSIVFICTAILYAGFYATYQKDHMRAPIMIANTLLSIVFFVWIKVDQAFFEVLIGSCLAYMFLFKTYKSRFHVVLGLLHYLIGLALLTEISITRWVSWEMLHWIVLLAATAYGLFFVVSYIKKEKTTILNIGVPYYTILLLIFVTQLSTMITLDSTDNVARIVLSISWIAIAIAVMIVGKILSIEQGKYVGVGILFLTLGKMILFDIPFVNVAIKALLFIILGVVGLLVSRAYYKK